MTKNTPANKTPPECVARAEAVMEMYKKLAPAEDEKKPSSLLELLRDFVHYSCKHAIDIHQCFGKAMAKFSVDMASAGEKEENFMAIIAPMYKEKQPIEMDVQEIHFGTNTEDQQILMRIVGTDKQEVDVIMSRDTAILLNEQIFHALDNKGIHKPLDVH